MKANVRVEGAIKDLSVMTFSDVVEAVKGLTTDEKIEIQLLLQQYLREERREEMYANLMAAKTEEENEQLTFSSNLQTLKKQLLED